MKHILIIFSVLLCGYTLAYPCGGSSCCCRDGGSSCGSGSSCCTGGGLSCCSKGRSSCCSETSCCTGGESSCCCEGGSSCSDEGGRYCCGGGGSSCSSHEKCCNPPGPATTPTPPIFCPNPPCPPTSGSSHNTSVSNNNNITIPTNITIQNDVHSETHVNVPISIVVNNQNDIQIKTDSNHGGSNCCDKNCTGETGEKNCTNSTKIITVTVPTPYPVPVPVPQPYIVTVPVERPVPSGCCTMVAPCMPYTHSGCMHNSVQCGGQCGGQSVMYQPTNLCQSGCLQVPSSYGVHCGMGGCNRTPVDCSMCNGNWGQTYDMFQMCSGCFYPMGWGGGHSRGGYYGK